MMVYDPKKAHDYYERTKHLKGLAKGAGTNEVKSPSHGASKVISGNQKALAIHSTIGRMRQNVSKLQTSLSECNAELSKKRQTSRTTTKANSDGKTTVKQRVDAKQYTDSHKGELSTKTNKSSGGGSSKSSSKNVSDMSVQDLRARATKIKGALRVAKRLLSDANQELGQLAHSAISTEPNVNEHFAQFQAAERIPSK